MSILSKIVARKKAEVAERKGMYPVRLLEKSIYFASPVVSLKEYILRPDKSGVIAEIKRKSPSKGVLNAHISVEKVSIGYMQAGASALSVLTDREFFGGSNDDLLTARRFNYCPILRKDFVIDEYQVVEARSIGADAVLLIAAALTPARTRRLSAFAKELGLEVLLELHGADELLHITDSIDVVGVNNRDLSTFRTSLAVSEKMAKLLPDGPVRISESGISDPATVRSLRSIGYNGFLIGETFMRSGRPEEACAAFIREIGDRSPKSRRR